MMRTLIGKSRFLAALVVAVAMATGAYAFTATNTVPASEAGSGSGTISGYTLSANATTVKAKIVSGSSTYTSCSVAGGVNVTCNFSPDIAITTADQLSVIATS
jgi:opacity protein-like surface antigen